LSITSSIYLSVHALRCCHHYFPSPCEIGLFAVNAPAYSAVELIWLFAVKLR